jgi:hypothetical protein
MSEEERYYYDQTARYAAVQGLVDYLRLVINAPPDEVEVIREVPNKLTNLPNTPDREGDLILFLRDLVHNSLPWHTLFEHKSYADQSGVPQALEYAATLYRNVRIGGAYVDLGVIVVNLSGRLYIEPRRLGNTEVRNVNAVNIVNFVDFSADEILGRIEHGRLGRICLSWIPLMQGGCESAIIQRWIAERNRETDPKVRSDCRHIALVFANLTKCKDVWVEALGEEEKNMPIPDIIQTWMNKAATKAATEAKDEERAETRKKGRIIFAIQKAQLKLGEELTPTDELLDRKSEDLQTLADEYEARLKAAE